MKEHYPVQTSEYAKANNIDDDAAFQLWVPYTLRKRDTIIASVKARIESMSIKFGIVVPRSKKHAQELDIENNNNFWENTIAIEMGSILTALDLAHDNVSPPGYTRSSGHLVFDVKMDFTRKARWAKKWTSDP